MEKQGEHAVELGGIAPSDQAAIVRGSPIDAPASTISDRSDKTDTKDEGIISPDPSMTQLKIIEANAHTQPPSDAHLALPTTQQDANPGTSEPISRASTSEPPPLNYTLKGRKRWIVAFWTLIIFDTIAIPLAIYFGLWYGVGPSKCPYDPALGHKQPDCPAAKLSANTVFSVSTACLGGASIFEYFLRFWRLWRKGSTCRVIGARRAYLDWFHWNYSIAWFFIMVELIVGTIPDWPPIRLLAMPPSSLLYWFGFQIIVEDILRFMGKKSPIRISSVPKGAHFRPGIYSIIEDVVAVDGSGGTEFRTRLNERFEQSHYFRRMLHRLTLFWGVGALGAAVLTTALVFTLERDAAYVVGWVLPFIWAAFWAWGTILYVKKELAHERREWGKPNAMRNAGRYSIDISRLE